MVNALCNICLLFFICDEAHYASQHVRTNFQKKLLMVELSWMNSDAQTEINMFLRATEMNPSNINCGGFFDVNRNLFKSVKNFNAKIWWNLFQNQKFLTAPSYNGNIFGGFTTIPNQHTRRYFNFSKCNCSELNTHSIDSHDHTCYQLSHRVPVSWYWKPVKSNSQKQKPR